MGNYDELKQAVSDVIKTKGTKKLLGKFYKTRCFQLLT